MKYYFYFEAFQCTQWHISSKEWHGFVHVFVIGLGYHPSPQYLRVVKINQQLAHFIVCSEKCPSCSKCLWLNFEHKRMTLCCFLCITIWSLKIFLKGSITLNTLTGQNIKKLARHLIQWTFLFSFLFIIVLWNSFYRYLALEGLCLMSNSEFSVDAVRKHQETVVGALKVRRTDLRSFTDLRSLQGWEPWLIVDVYNKVYFCLL